MTDEVYEKVNRLNRGVTDQEEAGSTPSTGSALTVEKMVERLATRGLLPREHNLVIWQTIDGQWGVGIETGLRADDIDVLAGSLKEALAELMRWTNRGADVEPNDKGEAQTPNNPSNVI